MSFWRNLPPLTALRAFAALAENGSIVKAGDALGVSHAAISQQIRLLESHMGFALVSRSGRELVLTLQGRALADAALAGFGGIARVAGELTGADAGRPLQITTTPSFAASWLMPRLADFRARHPGINLVVDPTPDLRPIGPDGVDVALRYGNGDWPGMEAKLLVKSSVVVVAAPSLVAGRQVRSVADLADLPWLEQFGTNEASAFLESHGVGAGLKLGMTALPGNLVLDGARDGQGVAVVATAWVQADIAAGRLTMLFEDTARVGYFVVTRPGVLRPPAKAFVSWAMRQADAAGPS